MTEPEFNVLKGTLFTKGYLCKESKSPLNDPMIPDCFLYKHIRGSKGSVIYTIMFRVWNLTKYSHTDDYVKVNPYKYDVNIIFGGSEYRMDLQVTSPKFSIQQVEDLAEQVYKVVSSAANNQY